MDIKYVIGDATKPSKSPAIICHVCNNIGGWGRGFVLALSKSYPQAERAYRSLPAYTLGEVQFVSVTDDIVVANMIAQEDIVWRKGVPPIRYNAVDHCLFMVAERALHSDVVPSIHCPRFGAGLAGGKWEIIEDLILKNLSEKDIEVFVYDLKN